MRSIYLHKDKSIFKLEELPVERFAESLGLPGVPKIKFLSKEIAKKKKNASRSVEATAPEVSIPNDDESEGGSEDDGEAHSSSEEDEAIDAESDEDATSVAAPPKSSKVRSIVINSYRFRSNILPSYPVWCCPNQIRSHVRTEKPKHSF